MEVRKELKVKNQNLNKSEKLKQKLCFQNVALEWWGRHSANLSEKYGIEIKRSLENHVFPKIGHLQNPLDEAGFHTGLVAPIIMRKSMEPDYSPDWDSWFRGYEKEHTKFRGKSEKDEFDSTLKGTWLERWDT